MKKTFMTVMLAGLLGLAACGPTAVQQAEENGERLMKLMPALVLPDDAEALGGGGGGSVDSVGSTQLLRTSLSLEELNDFYSSQLSAASWQLISEEHSGETIYSTWEVTDEDGSVIDGTLDVTFGNHSSELTTTPEFADAYTVNVTLTLR